MSNWENDDQFSGIDWDGDGKIGWYDQEFDREVYRKGYAGMKPSESRAIGIIVGLVIAGFLIGMLIPAIGAMILVGLWLFGFSSLMSWIFK